MPQGRVPDRRKSVVCSLLRVLQRHSKIFHSVLHAKGRRPCQKARKPHLTHCRSIYYICIYQTFPYFCGMKKDFNTGLRKGIEADRVKLTRRRKLLLREMGLAEDLSRGASSGLRSASGRVFFLTPGAPSSLTNPSASCLFKQYRQECKS